MRACTSCGACCVAPDISTLGKGLGVPCIHLGEDLLCTIYEMRPAICRSYQADAFCDLIDAPTLKARVHKYLSAFDLLFEAGLEIPQLEIPQLKIPQLKIPQLKIPQLKRQLPLLKNPPE
jgi:uncharacterized protein